MNKNNNVKDALKFSENMKITLDGIYNIFESTFEKEFPQKTDRVTGYVDKKCCFEVSNQHERPHDFLQSLLDIIRVMYEPMNSLAVYY